MSNPTSDTSLLSETQLREFHYIVDSVSRRHRLNSTTMGTQQLVAPNDVPFPFNIHSALAVLPRQCPTQAQTDQLLPDAIGLTSDAPWYPQQHHDVVDIKPLVNFCHPLCLLTILPPHLCLIQHILYSIMNYPSFLNVMYSQIPLPCFR